MFSLTLSLLYDLYTLFLYVYFFLLSLIINSIVILQIHILFLIYLLLFLFYLFILLLISSLYLALELRPRRALLRSPVETCPLIGPVLPDRSCLTSRVVTSSPAPA